MSPDRGTTLIPVTLVGDIEDASTHVEAYLAAVAAQNRDGVRVLTVGELSAGEEFTKLAESDLVKGEGLGLLAALVVLVVVFGALVVAGVPIVLAIASIIVAVGLTAVLGQVMDLSFFIVNMITMIGLAVGIDYALFIVSRYREERRRGWPKHQAIEMAGGTASKAVLFSGTTVVLALLGHVPDPDRDLPQSRCGRDPRRGRRRRRDADAGAGPPEHPRRQDRLAPPSPLRRRDRSEAGGVRPRDDPRAGSGAG